MQLKAQNQLIHQFYTGNHWQQRQANRCCAQPMLQ